MTTAQWLYTLLLILYIVLFLLFTRMFYWRHYAHKKYYTKRPLGLSQSRIADLAHQAGKELPHFSIFVPARNEADVIEKTIAHLSHLNYDPSHYEILIVTDEKEARATAVERRQVADDLLPFLTGARAYQGGEKHDAVLLALLSRLALEEAQLAERKAGPHLSVRDLHTLSPHQRQEVLREIAQALLSDHGRIDQAQLEDAIRRQVPSASHADVARLYPLFLSFAIPTVMAATQLQKQPPDKLAARLMSEAAQARRPLTQKVLTALSEAVVSRIVRRIHTAPAEKLADWLHTACAEALPTTQEIVERKRREFAGLRNLPALKHVEVPWDFDGAIGGVCTGSFVPSTKGRALNYAFGFASDRSIFWGFYDAESRPEGDVLLYMAWRHLTGEQPLRIAQGPVFQVRNFWKTSPVSKVASLYQAVSHEWQYPYLLRSVPFIGGTNFYAARDLMLSIGGFDTTVLTEDMELGARAWLKGGAWPEFLPYTSSEQTPPTLRTFFRQRLRWGSGYLQVYDKLKADPTLPQAPKNKLLRTYFLKGHISWPLFQLVALLPIFVPIAYSQQWLDPTGAPRALTFTVSLLMPTYFLFTLYTFFHFHRYMERTGLFRQMTGFAQLFLLPFSAFFLPMPYSSAMVLKWMGRLPSGWVKTPRTRE